MTVIIGRFFWSVSSTVIMGANPGANNFYGHVNATILWHNADDANR